MEQYRFRALKRWFGNENSTFLQFAQGIMLRISDNGTNLSGLPVVAASLARTQVCRNL